MKAIKAAAVQAAPVYLNLDASIAKVRKSSPRRRVIAAWKQKPSYAVVAKNDRMIFRS
jgi:hypothetical protein